MKTQLFALAFLVTFIGACEGDFGVVDATDAGSDAQKADVRVGSDVLARDTLISTNTITSTGTRTGTVSTTTSTDGTFSIGTNLVTCTIPCPANDPQCGLYLRRPTAKRYLEVEGAMITATDSAGGSCCVQTAAAANGVRKVIGLNCSLCTDVTQPGAISPAFSCPWRPSGYGDTAVCLLNAGMLSVKFIGWDCLI